MQRYPGSIAPCDHSAQTSQTDGLASWHKREMYILHLALKTHNSIHNPSLLLPPLPWCWSLESVRPADLTLIYSCFLHKTANDEVCSTIRCYGFPYKLSRIFHPRSFVSHFPCLAFSAAPNSNSGKRVHCVKVFPYTK